MRDAHYFRTQAQIYVEMAHTMSDVASAANALEAAADFQLRAEALEAIERAEQGVRGVALAARTTHFR